MFSSGTKITFKLLKSNGKIRKKKKKSKTKTKIKDRSCLVLSGITENIVFLEKSYAHDGKVKMVRYGQLPPPRLQV